VKITTITARYGRTQSLRDYCNARPEITLNAELEAGDDPDEAKAQLMTEARRLVEAECDDALERDDQPAKFDPAPRYTVIRSRIKRWYGSNEPTIEPPVIAVIPAGTPVPEGYASVKEGVRVHHASRIAAAAAEEKGITQPIIYCPDGDLSALPVLPPEPEPLPFEHTPVDQDTAEADYYEAGN
jgi:hypothetical protein